MRCVVTGAAGFIGSHLVDRLLAAGHHVMAIDDLSTGSLENLLGASRNRRFRFRQADVRDPDEFCASNFDVLYHLACPASPKHYQRNPVRTLETAFLGTRRALDLADSEEARIVIASTSEVYGDPEIHPQREDYWGRVNPIGPRSCYDEGKRAAEALAVAYSASVDEGRVRIARIFNTYGPRMAEGDGRLLPNLITQALAGEPLTVYGDGTQTRSLCYVSDTVDALIRLGEANGAPLVTNVGNPDERTVRSIAEDVARAVGREGAAIESRELPADDPRRRCPDVTRARAALGWSPQVPLAEGLARTVEWFRSRVGRAVEAA